MPDWFRSPDWDAAAQADFEARLRRARAWGRPQYLRIKGLSLERAGETAGARALWERVLEEAGADARLEQANALEHLADSYAEEDPAAAVGYRERAFELQQPTPAQLERQRVAEQRAAATQAASAPVLRALAGADVDLDSIWDLNGVAEARPRAIPVLLHHLTLDYPDGVLEDIGQALDNRDLRPWWPDVAALYRAEERGVAQERLAVVLATCAQRAHYAELVDLAHDESRGQSRIMFLRAINRIGNRISPGQGRAVIAEFADHHELGVEASAILDGRSMSH